MGWKPISQYDVLRVKPKSAAFFFKGTPPSRGKYTLPPTVQLTRYFGSRICTHWHPLADWPVMEDEQ